jgi:hypothetical protein
MFINEDLDEQYKEQFFQLGIYNQQDMLAILNGFDAIAEIGYVLYKDELRRVQDD